MRDPGSQRSSPRCGKLVVGLLAAVALVLVLGGRAGAQNFPPVAVGSAPDQVFVGDAVAFSSAGSIDPDGSPQPLTFQWDFDDGTVSTEASPDHAFTAARAYPVTLTVSDGADTAIDVVIVHVLARPLPVRPRRSSPIALAPAGDRLFVANPDSSSISIVAVTIDGLALIEERPVCRRPRTVSLSADATVVYVACQGERAIAAVDVASGTITLVAVGAEPYGVVALASGAILVTNQGDDSVSLVSPDLATVENWSSGPDPRAIAVSADGTRAFVSTYRSRTTTATVTIHDLTTRSSIASIGLDNDPGPDTASSGRGVPNLLSAATIDPSGQRLWVGGLKANTSVGLFRTGGAIAPVNWLRGLAAPIDLSTSTEVLARRIDTNDADSVSAIELSSDGRYAYLTHQGAGRLSIYDLSKATLFDPGAGTSVPFEARIDTGDAPQGLAISPDGAAVYVLDYLSRDVVAVDVRDPAAPRVTSRVVVTGEPLAADILDGKRLFYRSREPMHSQGNYVACASCHADGALTDGQVWDLTQGGEGLRNTIDLRARAGMGQGLVHWSANFDEIQDFENPIVTLFGGTGLAADGAPPNSPLGAPNAGRSQELDDLAAYVTSLAYTPQSPARASDGTLVDAARRGEALFQDPALRCVECHPPPRFTTSALDAVVLIDVGTLTAASGNRLGEPLTGLDVPTLIGLWEGAPYYHDGSAPTLRDVFRGRPGTLEAQLTANLDEGQLDDLLTYLRSIDAPAPEPEPDPDPDPDPASSGCGCGAAGSSALPGLLVVLVPLVPRRRRRRRQRNGDTP